MRRPKRREPTNICAKKRENGHTVIVSSEFARQLEVELAVAIAELRELRRNKR
jgi:hypothetical protein